MPLRSKEEGQKWIPTPPCPLFIFLAGKFSVLSHVVFVSCTIELLLIWPLFSCSTLFPSACKNVSAEETRKLMFVV